MKGFRKETFKDVLHEFIIFVIVGLGIGVPIVVYTVAEIISNNHYTFLFNPGSFTGGY